jgi:hypothetical protein
LRAAIRALRSEHVQRLSPITIKSSCTSTIPPSAEGSGDGGCIFPGCCNTRYIDAHHHIRHWTDGGETSLENLSLVCCWHHHRLLHEGGFQMRRDAHEELYFVRPDGRLVPRCGYRTEDRVDDFVAARVPQPSAEVREQRGVYRAER